MTRYDLYIHNLELNAYEAPPADVSQGPADPPEIQIHNKTVPKGMGQTPVRRAILIQLSNTTCNISCRAIHERCLNGSSGQSSNTGAPDEKNRSQLIYQPAGWQSAGNGAKLEPRSSSRAGKNRTSSAADKKRHRCRSCSRTRLKMKSKQLDEETS
ncbi:hypothetical protein F511_21845 [Dorcoceras hygrometricum]|uniref:Uncharacterized protein n=1 Tax=Dorcoceras hygrometricum TaxID=472368 RepID=A0A2Z7AAB0_9LAMI|nr:hypothetical protein F511_21845 [Dorcoceras hygrometricum]